MKDAGLFIGIAALALLATRRSTPAPIAPITPVGDLEPIEFEPVLLGCSPSKHNQMKNVRLALDVKYGSYMNLPKSIRQGYDWLYGDCLGYRDF
jgi:hypothetical protein